MSKKVGRNEPCPCGSGKKYKNCCWNKGFEFVRDAEGEVSKSIPMSKEVREIIDMQEAKFRARFGRDMGPDDHVFFDMPHIEHTEAGMVDAMREAGIPLALVYAFEKTGRIVTEENKHLIPDIELKEWDDAVREYYATHGGEEQEDGG